MGIKCHTEEGIFVTLCEENHVAAGLQTGVDLGNPAKVSLDRATAFKSVDKWPQGTAVFITETRDIRSTV